MIVKGSDKMSYLECYQELLLMINNSCLAFSVKEKLDKINSDLELVEKIEKYHEICDDKVKLDIYNNKDFIEYKRLETEVNLLSLKLNKIFKGLNNESN